MSNSHSILKAKFISIVILCFLQREKVLERYVKDFVWCSHLRLGFKRILRILRNQTP